MTSNQVEREMWALGDYGTWVAAPATPPSAPLKPAAGQPGSTSRPSSSARHAWTLAAEAGVEVDRVEGDAEACRSMTKPARELVRVLRTGGRLGTLFRYLPPQPGTDPPPLWGQPDHVRSLFSDAVTLTF